MKPTTLTLKGITTITESKNIPVIVQVLNLQPDIKQINNEKAYISEISDGYAKLKCYWNSTVFDKITEIKDKFNGAVVTLTDYYSSAKKTLVYDFNIIYLLDQIIGNPTSYQNYLANNLNQGSDNKIDISKAIIFQQPEKIIKTTQKRQSNKANTISNTINPVTIIPNNSSHYETIDQLYTGMDNWTLLCRVNKARFREFSNKKGSRTQLLQFQIRDKANWTINCAIFGDYAKKMSNNIHQGQVYQFSRGNIKVDTYKTPSHEKQSAFTITFTQHSRIFERIDDGLIQKQNTYNTISKIKQWKINGFIDVACIIKQIKPQSVYVNKSDNQTYPKRVMIICDPTQKIQIEVTFWRDGIEAIDQSLLHKAVVLESFKVHQYNSKLSLTAVAKSKIIQLNGHKLNKYQNNDNLGQFESISYKKDENRQNVSNIKKLLQQCEKLQEKQVVWSTFRVYINRTKDQGKKMYGGCPLNNCRKAVEDLDFKCPHCGKAFQKPIYRYIVGIQISDSLGTGSIWTSAYDEFFKKILSYDQDLPAQKARSLSDESFNEIIKRCYFQQYKLTLCSKLQQTPDSNRRIRHRIVSYSIVDYVKQSKLNLQKIKSILEKKQL